MVANVFTISLWNFDVFQCLGILFLRSNQTFHRIQNLLKFSLALRLVVSTKLDKVVQFCFFHVCCGGCCLFIAWLATDASDFETWERREATNTKTAKKRERGKTYKQENETNNDEQNARMISRHCHQSIVFLCNILASASKCQGYICCVVRFLLVFVWQGSSALIVPKVVGQIREIASSPPLEKRPFCREQQGRRFSGFFLFVFCLLVLFACLVCLFLLCFMLHYAVVIVDLWLFLFFVFMIWCACVFGVEQALLFVGCAVLLPSIMVWLTWVFVLFGTQDCLLCIFSLGTSCFFWFGFSWLLLCLKAWNLETVTSHKRRVNRLSPMHSA